MNTLSFIARFRTPALLKVALAPALCPRITLLKAGGMRPPGMYAAELALPTITVGFGDWPTATAGAVAAVQPEGAFATIGVAWNRLLYQPLPWCPPEIQAHPIPPPKKAQEP